VAEWLKASVSKTDILSNRYRGFESRPLRQRESALGWIFQAGERTLKADGFFDEKYPGGLGAHKNGLKGKAAGSRPEGKIIKRPILKNPYSVRVNSH
jgi:hypothetical protein